MNGWSAWRVSQGALLARSFPLILHATISWQRSREAPMEALFIGQAYVDVTVLTDESPNGDEKAVAAAYAISFGGNAVTAAIACAKLGIAPDLSAQVAD